MEIRSGQILLTLQVILLILVAFSLPLSIHFNSVLIILLILNSIGLIITKSGYDHIKKDLPLILTLASLFLIYLFAATFSKAPNNWFIIEKKFSILVMPLALYASSHLLTTKYFNWILAAFVFSTGLATILSLYGHWDLFFQHSEDIGGLLVIHRPYFGLYVLFSVFILLYVGIRYKHTVIRIALVLFALYFIYFAYLIYAKMAILAFLLTCISLPVLYLMLEGKFKRLFLYLGFLMCALLILVLSSENVQMILSKVVRFESFDLGNRQWIYYLSLNMRYAIWDCCWNLLTTNNNWLWGAGLNHQEYLNACYYTNYEIWIKHGVDLNEDIVTHFPFNAHNEYLETWLDLGISGLLILFLVIGVSFWLAIKRRNFLYLTFIILFFLCCLTEAMFSVQKGIVFYAFFNSLFVFRPVEENDNNKLRA